MDAPEWFVLWFALHNFYWLLTFRVGPNGRWEMWWLLVLHRIGIVRYFYIFIFFILTTEWRRLKCIREGISWHCWRDIQRSLVNRPPRQSSFHTQLLLGKLGSLRTTSTSLRARVLMRFASLYVNSLPLCYNRKQIYCHFVLAGILDCWRLGR